MPEYRNGDWIMTSSGVHFYPLDPRPEEVKLTDIAHHLSALCRWTGAPKGVFGQPCHFSVAEHAINVARALPKEYQLAGLHHDDAEAYISDISSPLKPYIGRYKDIETKLMAVIANKIGFTWPLPPIVKTIDQRMLADEGATLMADPEYWVTRYDPTTGATIACLPSQAAAKAFIAAHNAICAGADLHDVDLPEMGANTGFADTVA